MTSYTCPTNAAIEILHFFQTTQKNLDPSDKMDLDFLVVWKEKKDVLNKCSNVLFGVGHVSMSIFQLIFLAP